MQEAAKVWENVSIGLKLNFSNCIQDVYNVCAIVKASREDSTESLLYLEKSFDVYKSTIDTC